MRFEKLLAGVLFTGDCLDGFLTAEGRKAPDFGPRI
jgi:hypothetical protein